MSDPNLAHARPAFKNCKSRFDKTHRIAGTFGARHAEAQTELMSDVRGDQTDEPQLSPERDRNVNNETEGMPVEFR